MYDLSRIKNIPCTDVANKYGITLNSKHGKLWGKLRADEKTSSFTINESKNIWYDFGLSKGGSVIDLVSHIENISPTDAILKLAVEYGIDREKTYDVSLITDNQYRLLGIQPERATRNFKFDCSKHSLNDMERWESKYGMPVRELAEKHPKTYDNMMETIGLRTINQKLAIYDTMLVQYSNKNNNVTSQTFIKDQVLETGNEINKLVSLLNNSLSLKATKYDFLIKNPEKDLNAVEIKGLSFDGNDKNTTHESRNHLPLINAYKRNFDMDISKLSNSAKESLYVLNLLFKKQDKEVLSMVDIINIKDNAGNYMVKFDENIKKIITTKNTLKPDDPDFSVYMKQIDTLNKNLIKSTISFDYADHVLKDINHIKMVEKNEQIKELNKSNTISKTIEMNM